MISTNVTLHSDQIDIMHLPKLYVDSQSINNITCCLCARYTSSFQIISYMTYKMSEFTKDSSLRNVWHFQRTYNLKHFWTLSFYLLYFFLWEMKQIRKKKILMMMNLNPCSAWEVINIISKKKFHTWHIFLLKASKKLFMPNAIKLFLLHKKRIIRSENIDKSHKFSTLVHLTIPFRINKLHFSFYRIRLL